MRRANSADVSASYQKYVEKIVYLYQIVSTTHLGEPGI